MLSLAEKQLWASNWSLQPETDNIRGQFSKQQLNLATKLDHTILNNPWDKSHVKKNKHFVNMFVSMHTAAPLNFLCLFHMRELIVITLAHSIKSSLWWHKDTKSKNFGCYTVKQRLLCARLFVCELCTEITSIKSQFIPQVSGNISRFWERFAVSQSSISTILVEKKYDIYSVNHKVG